MAENFGLEKMVFSTINPYRIADPMTYRTLDWKYITSHLSWNNPKLRLRRRVGLFQLSWGVMYFSIQDSVSHGIAPIPNGLYFWACRRQIIQMYLSRIKNEGTLDQAFQRHSGFVQKNWVFHPYSLISWKMHIFLGKFEGHQYHNGLK